MPDPKENALPHQAPTLPITKEDEVPATRTPAGIEDEPSPEVVAIFLRPKKAPALAVRAPDASPAAESAHVTPADGMPSAHGPLDESLIDSLTRIVTEMLQAHVRESVTAAVRALAPRLVVSLPAEGTDGATGANKLRTRPTQLRERRKHE